MDKRLFIPSYYFMAELARDGKESAFADPKRFGEEYASRKRGNARFHVSLWPYYGGYLSPRRNAGKQEPGIQLAHLIFYWNKKCFGHSAFYLTSVYFFSLPTEANLAYKAIGLDSNPARIPAEHQKVGTRVRIPGQLLLSTTVRLASMVAAGIGSQ